MRLVDQVFHGLPSSVPTRPFVVDPSGLFTYASFLHLVEEQKYSPLNLSQTHLWSANGDLITGLDSFPEPFPKGAPLGGLPLASSAPHWPALDDPDPDDVLVDVASAGSAPHWPALGFRNARCGGEDVGEIYLPSPLPETLCTTTPA